MTPAQVRLLASCLIMAILLGLITWRLWRRGQMRFSALEAALFKRTPEGWTFDSRRWTYLLTDAQKQKLTEGLRRCVLTAALVTIGFVILPAIPIALWLRLLGGSQGAWLLLGLALVLVCGMLVTAVSIAQKRWVHPVLRDARRIGSARPVSVLRLTAETTSIRELRRRIILITLALSACVLFVLAKGYLSVPSPDTEALLVLAALFGLLDIWYVAVLVFKLGADRSPPGPRGSSSATTK